MTGTEQTLCAYLLVKNPARFRSEVYDQTALAELFKRNRVPVLELPTISALWACD
jgi:hypothetical protein